MRMTYRLVDVHYSASTDKGRVEESYAHPSDQEIILPLDIPSLGF